MLRRRDLGKQAVMCGGALLAGFERVHWPMPKARGELARGAVDVAPLPPPLPADAGPARLQFRNQDYPLRGRPFLLGRQPDCDLVFDSDQYPTVSGRKPPRSAR